MRCLMHSEKRQLNYEMALKLLRRSAVPDFNRTYNISTNFKFMPISNTINSAKPIAVNLRHTSWTTLVKRQRTACCI